MARKKKVTVAFRCNYHEHHYEVVFASTTGSFDLDPEEWKFKNHLRKTNEDFKGKLLEMEDTYFYKNSNGDTLCVTESLCSDSIIDSKGYIIVYGHRVWKHIYNDQETAEKIASNEYMMKNFFHHPAKVIAL